MRNWLKQNLSPEAFRYLKYLWWQFRFYYPRLISSNFVNRTADVQEFNHNLSSHLLSQLRTINVFGPTRMCRVMTRHGSDKGNGWWHNYTPIYSGLFGKFRNQALIIFELGLGTNNPERVSNMGWYGRPGASLRGWRDLFPKALVFGADIDRDTLFEDHRIKTFYCDQLDGAAIQELWSQSELQDGADIIIDDGLHTFEGNATFLDFSLDHLRPGGYYIVEDIVPEAVEKWQNQFENVYSNRFLNYEFWLVTPPNPFNNIDNRVLIVYRNA
jgi:hypothetical protein